ASLNLGPFLAGSPAQSIRVLVERLVEDTNKHDAPIGAAGAFGEILQNMDVAALGHGMFKALAEFVENDEEARALLGLGFEHGDQNTIVGGGLRRLLGVPAESRAAGLYEIGEQGRASSGQSDGFPALAVLRK